MQTLGGGPLLARVCVIKPAPAMASPPAPDATRDGGYPSGSQPTSKSSWSDAWGSTWDGNKGDKGCPAWWGSTGRASKKNDKGRSDWWRQEDGPAWKRDMPPDTKGPNVAKWLREKNAQLGGNQSFGSQPTLPAPPGLDSK